MGRLAEKEKMPVDLKPRTTNPLKLMQTKLDRRVVFLNELIGREYNCQLSGISSYQISQCGHT